MKRVKKCPICRKGTLERKIVEYEDFGIMIGRYPADVCSTCGEQLFDEETAVKIEQKEKELGIFGLSKEVEIKKIGSSYGLIIPKVLAKFLNLREHLKALLIPESKKKLIITLRT